MTTTPLRLRPATVADGDRIREFLSGLSPDALYQRFLTGMGTPSPTLVRFLANGGEGAALLAEYAGTVVGHGLWAPARIPHDLGQRTAELAVVVADVHQRRGIGTALVEALVVDLARRGYGQARVVTFADNLAVQRMVAREAPGVRPERDGGVWTYDLPVRSELRRLPRSA
jgi:GNAT superfamily N-acetyltransferase